MVSKSASRPLRPASSTAPQRFKGVRMRSWGKWVSEIRLPNTRARLWLGSFTTAEQAARAFDVAVVCLRGYSATLNFPNSPPTYAPLGLPHHQIQELAAAAAAAATAASSPVYTPHDACEITDRSNSDQSERATNSSASESDESEAATIRSPSGSEESGAATRTSSSSCCSSPFDDSATFAGLLELDEENEQSSALDVALQDHTLKMGREWDDLLLWEFSMTEYQTEWEESLLLLSPPLPIPVEDDLLTMVEPSLWSL